MPNKLEVLSQMGFTRDPFYGHDHESADAIRVKTVLSMAIAAHAQVAVIGERGVGKTRAVNATLRDLKVKAIRILTPDKARVTAGDIQEAMLCELTTEKVRQDREIRIRQLRRILGEASRKGPLVIVIEEAHRLNGNTLRSLKNIRELDWMGETHLFAVVLIGQADCTQQLGLSEVRLRTETIHMHGLTSAEIVTYVGETVGRVMSEEAIAAVSGLQEARNYLDLQEILVAAMEIALAYGRDRVLPSDVAEIYRSRNGGVLPAKADKAKSGAAVSSVLERRRGQTAAKTGS